LLSQNKSHNISVDQIFLIRRNCPVITNTVGDDATRDHLLYIVGLQDDTLEYIWASLALSPTGITRQRLDKSLVVPRMCSQTSHAPFSFHFHAKFFFDLAIVAIYVKPSDPDKHARYILVNYKEKLERWKPESSECPTLILATSPAAVAQGDGESERLLAVISLC
jgi:hypothetical protein